MAIQEHDCRKRLREQDNEPFLRGSRSPCKGVAAVVEDTLLGTVVDTREARRSDNSDTIPVPQNVDGDSPEIPAHGFPTRRKPASYQSLYTSKGIPSSAVRPAASLMTRFPTRFSSLSSLELQYQLIQLDILEQELLNELRSARCDYDARVVQLGDLGGPAPTAALRALGTMFPQSLPIQQRPIASPLEVSHVEPTTCAASSSLGNSALSSGPAATGSAVMPPPPPRPPRGHYASQRQSKPHSEREWQGRTCRTVRPPAVLPTPPPQELCPLPQEWWPVTQ